MGPQRGSRAGLAQQTVQIEASLRSLDLTLFVSAVAAQGVPAGLSRARGIRTKKKDHVLPAGMLLVAAGGRFAAPLCSHTVGEFEAAAGAGL